MAKESRKLTARFKLRKGELLDESGAEIGKVEGGTLEVRLVLDSALEGGVGGGVLFEVEKKGTKQDGGSGGKSADRADLALSDPGVKRVWATYLAAFPGTKAKLGPARAKSIARVLQDFDADQLCNAVVGLSEFRKRKAGPTNIETIWKTFRGTGSMTERVEFFIGQAEGSTLDGKFPSADRAIVAEKQRLVQRGHRLRDEGSVKQAKDAEQWLREHGIETVRDGDDGYPTFRPLARTEQGGA